MTAPVLVALAPGSPDARSRRSLAELVAEVRRTRPDLRVEAAVLAHGSPSLDDTLARLADEGVEEVVVVPLLLVEPHLAGADLAGALDRAGRRHPRLRLRASAVLGPEPSLLEVLDLRLRDALAAARVRELDALVLAAQGTADALANQAVARLARLWGTHHRLPVSAAYAVSAPPATGEAVRAFRGEGRRHIAVGSLFWSPGPLHDRASELALEAGAVAVSAPLGAHPSLARLVLARYAVGAVELVPV
ncbi:sirohydrochlorin chelatase [Nocardioides lentus]|uniref:Sirohydrochlorin chelatase n=1 Tax=Nocardioides lentus TaxID=338077 RepID=A0ABN2PPG8_9ACTN